MHQSSDVYIVYYQCVIYFMIYSCFLHESQQLKNQFASIGFINKLWNAMRKTLLFNKGNLTRGDPVLICKINGSKKLDDFIVMPRGKNKVRQVKRISCVVFMCVKWL